MNRKVIFICILLWIDYSQLNAQSWSIGVEGGPTWSRINAESVENETSRFGYQLKLWINKSLGKRTLLQTGLQFITQGAVNERLFRQNETVKWEYNFSYFNMPFELRYNIHDNINLGGGLYAGLLTGFNVSREATFSNSLNTPDRSNLQSHDLGYLLRVAFSLNPISVCLNYQHSFVELPKSNLAQQLIPGARNSSIQLFVGYTLFQTK